MREAAATPTFQETEERLTWSYQGLMGVLSPAGRDALRAAERDWIDQRNRACGFEALVRWDCPEFGSVSPVRCSNCASRAS